MKINKHAYKIFDTLTESFYVRHKYSGSNMEQGFRSHKTHIWFTKKSVDGVFKRLNKPDRYKIVTIEMNIPDKEYNKPVVNMPENY